MNDIAIGIVGIFILMGMFLTGIELAFAMALTGFLGYAYLTTFSAACNIVAKDFFDTFTSYTLTVIPLFVLMGQIAYHSGTAKRIYGAAHQLVGQVPGGLAMTTVVGATLFKAMCGSTLATAATFSSLAVPEMRRHGYSRRLSSRSCGFGWNSWSHLSTQHYSDNFRYYFRTINWRAFPGWDSTGPDHLLSFFGSHLRVGKNRPFVCT